MSEMKYPPTRMKRYRLDEVLKDLELPDSPFFTFVHEDEKGTIQTSHVTDEQLLTVPGLGSTWWKYIQTTNEDCPIFKYVGDLPITAFVDLEPYEDSGSGMYWWATPKGFPRKQ